MSTDGHIVCESSERELEQVGCVPQVGNSSPSGVELNVEFRQTGKAETRLGVSQFSEKSEHGSETRFSDVCSEDYPAEQLSSSFQSPVKASGSISIRAAQSDPAAPAILLLYWTLVKDGVLPGGFEAQFALLETAILRGAKRALNRAAGSDNLTAAVWLHQRSLQDKQKERSERLAVDQFLLAALERPSKFKARWQEKYYDGPNARRDAEEALRAKWLQELEVILKGTKTPMGAALENRLGDRNLLGGGRRASTLRARVRASRKYLAWLAVSADVAFPSEVSHLTGYLESRHTEPCNRGALKAAHQSMAFLEDVAGVEEKLTTNAFYTVVYRELLATAQPGRTPKQAHRYPVAVLESFEELVVCESATFYLRVYAWWLLLQCWGTLRFADHRGLNPGKGFEVKGNALEARLTHSKTIGADRNLSYRLVLVSEHCYVRKPNWLSSGWQVLSQKADFPRDYLLPMPSGNLKGCLQRELRYDTAYALQKRVMDVLVSDGQKLFTHGVGHFWSPHSGRNFLPSAAGALNVDKSDRDMLGGWAAQESDRYNRVARLRIRAVQAQVAETFADRVNHDPLFEGDAIEEFRVFLQGQGTSVELQTEYIQKVSRRSFAFLPRHQELSFESVPESMGPERFGKKRKLRLRRSWKQRERQMFIRGNRPGTQSGLRSLGLIPRRQGNSSGKVFSQASISPSAPRRG